MTNFDRRSEEVLILLRDLLSLLEVQHEKNWSRGLRAAVDELADSNFPGSDGYERARSIYNSMMAGGRGFAEYFIWSEDENMRNASNLRLDEIRQMIWEIFNR